MRGPGAAPAGDSEAAQPLRRHGDAHEARHLARLRAAGRGVVEIVKDGVSLGQGVAATRAALPERVRVGTVDKFQGQQARVVFYSMASSSSEDVPRGLDFLFSRNRLNVAVSRAQCLAYLVCSPRLLEVDCRTIDHMRLANALCRFVELASGPSSGESASRGV